MRKKTAVNTASGRSRSGKRMYLDVLRAWAVISVIICHAALYYSEQEAAGIGYISYNVCNSILRTAVPTFLMISGALLLDEGYAYSEQKLIRMIRNRASFFVLWSACYTLCFAVLKPLLTVGAGSLYEVLDMLVNGYYHLWFIPMLIGIYLILPLLRLWVKRENRKYVEYFLFLSMIFTSVLPFVTEKLVDLFPGLEWMEGLYENLSLQYTAGYTGYFILGWYLNTYPVKNPKPWYVAGFLGMLLTFAGTQSFTMLKGEPRNFYSVFAVNILLHTIGHFLFVKNWLGDRLHDSGRLSRFVQLVCVNSMGIYAVHQLIIQLSFKILGLRSPLYMIPLVSLVAFGGSLMCTRLLSRIPIAKDYMVYSRNEAKQLRYNTSEGRAAKCCSTPLFPGIHRDQAVYPSEKVESF